MSFALFGPSHLAVMALTAAGAALLCLVARRAPSARRPLRLALGGFLLAAAGAYIVYETLRGTLDVWDFVPLHLCDFAIFLAAFALFFERRGAAEILYFWALAGTSLAIVTPDLHQGFPHPRFLFYFGLHGGVVTAALFLVFGLRMVPRPGAPWRAFGWLLAYAAVVAVVNFLTGANFLYLRERPSAPTLLDHFGPWPVYILVVAAIALALFWLLYVPWARHRPCR